MDVYGDDYEAAKKNAHRSDGARSAYYKKISGKTWGNRSNYRLMLDSSVGVEKSAEMLFSYITAYTET